MSKQTQDHIVDVNKKVTAVEWFFEQIMYADVDIKVWREIYQQAKEMEKEQLINFTDDYVDNCVIPNDNMAIPTLMDVPSYYNETFKD